MSFQFVLDTSDSAETVENSNQHKYSDDVVQRGGNVERLDGVAIHCASADLVPIKDSSWWAVIQLQFL